MAVIYCRAHHTSKKVESSLDTPGSITFPLIVKPVLELELSPRDGSKQLAFSQNDDYFAGPLHGLSQVEARDAQLVPEYDNPNILDLSTAMSLDTPSIIDSIVDVLPFRFNNASGTAADPVPPPPDRVSEAAARELLGIDDSNIERFQDLGDLIGSRSMLTASSSPVPLMSPTSSVYSDVTVASPTPLLSAASTSNDTMEFFSPDFEVISAGKSSMKAESDGESKDHRYAEMRRRNNIASRRSRQTRREKEREMEQQLKKLFDDNVALKTRVKTLEDLVENTKKIILKEFTKRNQH